MKIMMKMLAFLLKRIESSPQSRLINSYNFRNVAFSDVLSTATSVPFLTLVCGLRLGTWLSHEGAGVRIAGGKRIPIFSSIASTAAGKVCTFIPLRLHTLARFVPPVTTLKKPTFINRSCTQIKIKWLNKTKTLTKPLRKPPTFLFTFPKIN